MSILIKGIEMPKDDELLCVNIYPDGKVCINLDLECKRIATAVLVPPHGRLINANAIIEVQMYDEMHEEWSVKTMTVDDYLAYAADLPPTIIEEEEGEDNG